MDEGKEEENNNEVQTNSWWGALPSWLQVAKEKSSNALEFMKRDLTEFSHVVQTDAVAAVSSTAAILKEKLTVDNAEAVAGKARQSISSVLETITDVFAPQREIEDTELIMIKNSEPVVMDWLQSQLYMIQKDPKTFCHEPEGPPEMYENWLESFDASEHQEEMTEIIMSCSEVRTLYDKLVPTSVSHLEFWQRYFYRVHLLRKAQAKRADLMRRAEQITIHNVEWDEDEEINTENHQHAQEKECDTTQIQEGLSSSTKSKTENQAMLETEETSKTVERILTNVDSNELKIISNNKDSTQLSSKHEEIVDNDKLISSDANETDVITEPSSADSTDGSRLSPVDSLGKDSSDDWEKDFDLEVNEMLQSEEKCQHIESQKVEEDDWEKWQ